MLLPQFYVDDIIKTALQEDINYLDTTTDLMIPATARSTARFMAKAEGVVCGLEVALRVFELLDPTFSYEIRLPEGSRVAYGDIIAELEGSTRCLLKGERTALNLLQHMSGVASATDRYVRLVEGTRAAITDTRKTLPGLRALQKYAVTVGGGKNHRFNLSDGAMLKDNHIDAAGGIPQAVAAIREKLGHMVKLEVETRNLDEVRQALTQHPDARGLIMDIRENIGGMTLYGARVAELLIPGVFHGCQKRTRSMTGVALASASQLAGWSAKDIERDIASGLTTREEVARSRALLGNAHFDEYEDCFGAEGQAALYDGPCLLLTSRHTVSAAEDFAAMLRSNRRALTLGTPTCGTTGTPLLQRLRCGGSMRVCSVAYRLLDGTEFIGRGIAPDAECEISADDLRAGTDSVLREALRRLREA